MYEQDGSLEIMLLVQGPGLTEREFDIYLQSVEGSAIGKCTCGCSTISLLYDILYYV